MKKLRLGKEVDHFINSNNHNKNFKKKKPFSLRQDLIAFILAWNSWQSSSLNFLSCWNDRSQHIQLKPCRFKNSLKTSLPWILICQLRHYDAEGVT